MKKYIFISFFTLFSVSVIAQNVQNNDIHARIGMYLDLKEDFYDIKIQTKEAKIAANFIITTFEKYYTIPDMNLSNIADSEEKKQIEILKNRLKQLMENPPSWDEIFALKNEIESTPPTPPVYAGDKRAREFYNAKYYNKTKRDAEGTPVLKEVEIKNDYKDYNEEPVKR